MAISAIIFDCFGVLAKNGWVPYRNAHFADKPEILREIRRINRLADTGDISYDEFIALVTQISGLSVEGARRLINVNSPNEDLLEFIRDRLKGKYKLGLLSNTIVDLRKNIFEPWQVELFDEMVLSYEVHTAKPDRRMYEIALERLGVAPEDCLFIDDQQAYLDGAAPLGIKTVLFENNAQAIRDIQAAVEGR